MKKRILMLVCVLALVIGCTVLSAAADTTHTAYCEYCKTSDVTWEPIVFGTHTVPEGETSVHKHYYFDKDRTSTVTHDQIVTRAGVTLCIDLNGKSWNSYGRAFNVNYNTVNEDCSTINIMDSKGGGTVTGRSEAWYKNSDTIGGTNNIAGGTIWVAEKCTMNIYGGTFQTNVIESDAGLRTTNGGVAAVCNGAVLNVYGGTFNGATVTKSGGAVHLYDGGRLNAYGGVFRSGSSANDTGACIGVAGSASKVQLSGNARIADIKFTYNNGGNLIIDGAFTGKANISYNTAKVTNLAAGLTVGVLQNSGSIANGDLFCTNGDGWLVNADGSALKLAAYTPSGARHYCAHCKEVVKWTVLPDSLSDLTAGHYHYYLAESVTPGQLSTANELAATICLDLYGNGIDTSGRAFIVKTNNTWNIMDSVGGGYIWGTSGSNNTAGGTVTVQVDSTMNLYGGTLKYTYDGTGHKLTSGGVVNMRGTVNLYGGVIEGADLNYADAPASTGAAVQMSATATLNVQDGSITAGAVPAGSNGPCVYVTTGGQVTLSGSGSVANIYFPTNNNKLTVTAGYTGTAGVTYGTAVALGEQVGAADAAGFTGKITCTNGDWLIQNENEKLILTVDAPVVIATEDGEQGYETLQAAIDSYSSGYIKLLKPLTESPRIGKDVYMDLNGQSITGTVTVESGTLFCKDSQTDDYTVADGMYGKLTAVGTVVAQEGYLKVAEGQQLSFHKATLQITDMTLRPAEAGIYYKSSFLGDEKVAAAVESFGVALSVYAIPDEDNQDLCGCSVFEDFVPGAQGNASASTLLTGILKTTNTEQKNSTNLTTDIHGRPYIKTADGYVFGAPVSRNLTQQLEAVDEKLETLTGGQLHGVMQMYKTYENLLAFMENAKAENQADALKILGIGNSYTIDCMWMLNAVYQAENPGKNLELGIVYYSGCTLSTHVKYINSQAAEYDYYTLQPDGTWKIEKDVNIAYIVNDKDWDLVSMQQGSGTSGVESSYNSDIQTIQNYVTDTLGYTPTFFWNMTWAYPEMDIPTDSVDLTTAPNANNFKKYYNSSQATMYRMITETVQNKILPDSSFRWIMPVGTAVQNAQSSYMTDLDLYRDYTHLNDFARLMAAYVWYSRIEGVTPDTVQLTSVPAALKKSYTGSGDMVLTEKQVAVLEESLKNALQTPFAVTQSQYTD